MIGGRKGGAWVLKVGGGKKKEEGCGITEGVERRKG